MKCNHPSSIAILAVTVVLTFLAMPIALLSNAPPAPRWGVLVIAPPWARDGGASGVVAAAGGRAVGPMHAPFAVLAVLDTPNHARNLGAWAVLDGSALALICGVSFPQNDEGPDLA